MKHNHFRGYLSCWAVFFVLYNIIVFFSEPLLGYHFNYDTRFWICFIATWIAFIGQILCAFVALKAKDKTELFYNISLIRISYIGLIIAIVFGLICMLVPDCPAWMAILGSAIVLGMNMLSVFKTNVAKEDVLKVDKEMNKKTEFIKNLLIETEILKNRTQGTEIEDKIKKLVEVIRYSDPISSELLEEIENQITVKMSELLQALENGSDKSNEICNEFIQLVDERNKRCKLVK